MALTCREFIESLDAYRSGDLGPNEHARYEDHLRQCLDCLAYLRSYEETIRLGQGAFRHPDDIVSADALDDLVRVILLKARASRPRH